MTTRCPDTFGALLDQVAEAFGDKVFLQRRHGQGGGSVSYADLRRDVRRLARGFLAQGVRRGDRVALVAENSYAWILADLSLAYIGAVDVPRGADTTPSELVEILNHSGCRFAIGETDRVVDELQKLRGHAPVIQEVWSLATESGVDGVLSIFELMKAAAAGDAAAGDAAAGDAAAGDAAAGDAAAGDAAAGGTAEGDAADLDAAAAEVKPDDLLTIVYTSGTTADPKGVMLTHHNMLNNTVTVNEVLRVGPQDVFLSALPAWHVYERIMDYLALSCGGELVFTTRRKIKEDLRGVQPTVFAAVPRIWESIHDGIVNHVEKLGGVKGGLMRHVLGVSREVGSGRAGAAKKLLHKLYRATLLKPLQKVTGGRIRIAVSGGGALPTHVDELLLGIGLPLLNGYGLTETSPVVCVRPPENNRVGTIGPPLSETRVEIRAEDGTPLPAGEIGLLWIQGPQVMQGYYANPKATRRVLTEDGWFNSGDLARMDEFGHFVITGRAKDTIVLAGGENVEPEPVETGIKSSALIDQAVVLGQDQKSLGAILIPMPESLEEKVPRSEWGERDGELTGDKVLALYRRELDRTLSRDSGFRPCERIARFRVRLDPMTVENGLLTPTMKVKRHLVSEQMANLIDGLFK